MRKLSEIRGEDALDVLANIIEPAAEIMTDTELRDLIRAKNNLKAIKFALQNHKRAVIEILAIMDGEDVETYDPGFATLPVKLLELLNDPDMQQVFGLQGQNEDGTISGSATENTKAAETE